MCMLHRHVGGSFSKGAVETDKLITSIEFDNCEWPVIADFAGPAGFQSTSIETASFKNCIMPQGTVAGVKTTRYDNCVMGGISNFSGPGLGLSYSISVSNCRVAEMLAPFYAGSLVVNDGVGVTYANGLFTINKAASSGNDWFQRGTIVPGQQLYLNAASVPQFSGNAGMGYITSITGDATNIYVQTTLGYATLPSLEPVTECCSFAPGRWTSEEVRAVRS